MVVPVVRCLTATCTSSYHLRAIQFLARYSYEAEITKMEGDLNSSSSQATTRPSNSTSPSRRTRTPAVMIAVTTVAVLASTVSASSRAGKNGSNGNVGRRPNTADPRLSRSLRDEAASLADGRQMLNDGLSVLGGALDDGGARRGAEERYGEEDASSLIDVDDLELLDSIFGSSPSSSKSSAVDGSDVFSGEYDGALDDDVDVGVDDEEIDGLFERAGKLLEADEGGEVDETLEYRAGNTWEDPIDEEYNTYDPYDEYFPHDGDHQEPLVDAADQREQWEAGGYLQQGSRDDDPQYDGGFDGDFYEDDMPPFRGGRQELVPEDYDEEGFVDEDGAYYHQQQQQFQHEDDDDLAYSEVEVVFDGGGGYDEYEYDYTDPALAMAGDEEFAEVVDEQQIPHQREVNMHDGEPEATIDTYQQLSNSRPGIDAYLSATAESRNDEEFDSEFADAAIAAARMEEEEERQFEAEVNAENTDNMDFDYIYEDRATLFVDDDDDGFVNGHPVPPVHAANSGIDSIIQAHRIAVAKDLGMESSPLAFSSPSVASATGDQLRHQHPRDSHSPSLSLDHPRTSSFGYGQSHKHGGGSRGRGFGGSGGGPFDDPEHIARMEVRRQKNERNFRREVSADVHKTYTSAVASVIRGDASPHVPANLFGQSLEEERAGCKLAGLSPEFDRNGMRNGKFCSEEELLNMVEWSALLHSTYGDQCGAVDVKTAKARLYGGAQYHRTVC